jgi:hypothetical protein
MNHLNEESSKPNTQRLTPSLITESLPTTPEVSHEMIYGIRYAARNYIRNGAMVLIRWGTVGAAVMLALIQLLPTVFRPMPTFLGCLTVLLVAPLVFMSLVGQKLSRNRATVKTLSDAQDVRYIGALVDALTLEDPPCQHIALNGLIEMLPRLKPEHSDLLDSVHRATLTRILSVPVERTRDKYLHEMFKPNTNPKRTAIRVTILKAYARLGDASALPIVRHLAERPATTESEIQVQRAALDTLPQLEDRVERQTLEMTLLRPAEGDSDTLLRPAQSTQESDPDLLLRPTSNKDEG